MIGYAGRTSQCSFESVRKNILDNPSFGDILARVVLLLASPRLRPLPWESNAVPD